MFKQLLQLRQPLVQLQLVQGGGHSMFTWRALIKPMLEWMTPELATNVKLVEDRTKRLANATGPAPAPPPGTASASVTERRGAVWTDDGGAPATEEERRRLRRRSRGSGGSSPGLAPIHPRRVVRSARSAATIRR